MFYRKNMNGMGRNAKRFCVPLVALMFSASVEAQVTAGAETQADAEQSPEVMVLTVEQAVDYALENSRTLKSNDIDLDIKARAAKYAWNVFLPTVQVSGTLARQNDIKSSIDSANSTIDLTNYVYKITTPHIEETESMHWAAIGTASASLNLSLAYIQQIRAAKADYEVGKISWEQNQKETVLNIKKLFYGLLLQQENLKVQQNSLSNARSRARQAQTNYNNGRIPELSLLNAQVTYQNKIPEVEQMEQTVQQQLDTFAFLIGLPVGTRIELSGSIEPTYIEVDTDDLLAKYGDASLDIQSLQQNIKVLKLNLGALNLAAYTPALALSFSLQPTLADAFNKSWFESDNWTDGGSFSATIAWNLTNLLPFSANRQQAKDLQANIAKLELTMETLRENQKLSVRKAVDTLVQARQQIDSMSRNITLAQRSYDMTVRSYNNGATELLDLRDSETQLNQAKLGLANQKFNYISALLDLENTLNTDLLGGTK